MPHRCSGLADMRGRQSTSTPPLPPHPTAAAALLLLAVAQSEISVEDGDKVVVTEERDGWVKVITKDDRSGWMPASYVKARKVCGAGFANCVCAYGC